MKIIINMSALARFLPLTNCSQLFNSINICNQVRNFNSHRAAIAKVSRQTYTRLYPTLLVQPDGSTISIRYESPRRIIRLPVDVNKLNEAERKVIMERRKPVEKLVVTEEIEDNFDINEYSHLWKK